VTVIITSGKSLAGPFDGEAREGSSSGGGLREGISKGEGSRTQRGGRHGGEELYGQNDVPSGSNNRRMEKPRKLSRGTLP